MTTAVPPGPTRAAATVGAPRTAADAALGGQPGRPTPVDA
ncbi:MAG: hypothetical protein AVDCRST_MAG35-2016, partial [uncultured Quadrisphaera sp.]